MFAVAEPLGGVRNLQVLNPTMTTLNVRWEPAEGRVSEYKVIYAPAAGGAESMVGLVGTCFPQRFTGLVKVLLLGQAELSFYSDLETWQSFSL